MGRGGGGGPRDWTAKSGALITNPGQLRKNVQRAMRKLLDKKLISVRSSRGREAPVRHVKRHGVPCRSEPCLTPQLLLAGRRQGDGAAAD